MYIHSVAISLHVYTHTDSFMHTNTCMYHLGLPIGNRTSSKLSIMLPLKPHNEFFEFTLLDWLKLLRGCISLTETQYSDFVWSPNRSSNPRFLIDRIGWKNDEANLGSDYYLRMSKYGQITESEKSKCTTRSPIPFSGYSENCRLRISNTILFSKFMVIPGCVNGVACGN